MRYPCTRLAVKKFGIAETALSSGQQERYLHCLLRNGRQSREGIDQELSPASGKTSLVLRSLKWREPSKSELVIMFSIQCNLK